MLRSRGSALLEMLLALSLAGIVMSIATTSMLRQQRAHSRIRQQSGSDGQLRAATTLLAAQLGELDGAAGDIATGSASDTALQFRATVVTSFACQTSVGSVALLPDRGAAGSYGGSASSARPGDTLWWLGDSTWSAAPVRSVDAASVRCSTPMAFDGQSVRLSLSSSIDSIPAGAPLRVTRQTRYSLYRSSDGSWQLGFREWSDAAGTFPSPQPVAGPLVLAVGARRSGFRYFDAIGQEIDLSSGVVDVSRIARVRITMRSVVSARDSQTDSVHTDSVDVGFRRGGR